MQGIRKSSGSYIVMLWAIVGVSVSVVLESVKGLHEFMKFILTAAVVLDQLALLLIAVYQLGIVVFGSVNPLSKWFKPSLQGCPQYNSQSLQQLPKFLCLTAAHNEEAVISEHVRNVLGMDYPKDRMHVIVIADNCTDSTAQLARALGASVWERFDEKERSKGAALRWAIHQRANLEEYDAVCIFDADNLVEPNFLSVMATHLAQGHEAIQAYLDTKNPWDSWISAAYASAYWYMNRFWQRVRVQLGLSGALGGTGFCLSSKLLQDNPWGARSLTEDLEYTMHLILRGKKVFWTHLTRVFDEKPVHFGASVPQRTRWLQGHWNLAFRYTIPLFRAFLSDREGARWRALDGLVYLWQPAVILFTGLNLIFTGAQIACGDGWYYPLLSHYVPNWFWGAIVALGLCLPLIALGLEDAEWKAFWMFPSFLLFNLTWIPITLQGLLSHKDRTWTHTQHSRSISFHDLSKSEVVRK